MKTLSRLESRSYPTATSSRLESRSAGMASLPGRGATDSKAQDCPVIRWYFAMRSSLDSSWFGSGMMQSTGQTSTHCEVS